MVEKMLFSETITCDDVDFTAVHDLVFWIDQKSTGTFLELHGTVVDSHSFIVTVSKAEAMKLDAKPVRMQFAFVDELGIPHNSVIKIASVDELLKEDGYGN